MRKVECRFCGGDRANTAGWRYNKHKRVRRYKCLSCGKKFTRDTFYIKMRYKPRTVDRCVDLHEGGMSYRRAAQHMRMGEGEKPSHMSIYRWSQRVGRIIPKFTKKHKVDAQDSRMNGDETMVMLKGGFFWNYNLVMRGTRFLFSRSFLSRDLANTKEFFHGVKGMIIGLPWSITTDGMPAYPSAISSAFYRSSYPRVEHVVAPGLDGRPHNNMIERVHNSIKDRVRTMRGFKNFASAAATLQLWALYYNFLRPHMALHGKTPAEAAGFGKFNLHQIIEEAYEQDRRDKRVG